MSKIEVDEIVNQTGDNDSGIDLTTNDQIAFKIANASKWTLNSSGNLFPASTSQGIVLGATSDTSANRLEDYEEGTWTPGISGRTLGSAYGFYTKIGNLVTVYFDMNTMAGGDVTSPILTGLPFTSSNSGSIQYAGYIMIHEPYLIAGSGDKTYIYFRISKNVTTGNMIQGGGDSGTFSHGDASSITMSNNDNARGMGQYFTDA